MYYFQDPLPIRVLRNVGLSPQKTLLCLFDLAALLGTALLVLLLRLLFGAIDPTLYRWVLPLLLLGPLLGASVGIYQSISLPPHREVKALVLTTSLVYALILGVLFLAKTGDLYSRLVLTGSWLATIFTLPILHGLCRRMFAPRRWWGLPVVIFDRSDNGREIWHYLRRHPERGLIPADILALPDDPREARAVMAAAAAERPHAAALIVHRAGRGHRVDYTTEANRFFSKILIVPDFGGQFKPYWLAPRDLGCVTGLLVRQNLHDKRRLCLKRSIDFSLCCLAALALLPLGLLLAAAVKLDSRGPVFFRQRRIGRGGREIRIFKFRTMMDKADAALQEHLAANPTLREEWERDHKLKQDPRITRMGAFLRKTSLDELPQLINVLMGDMSLVGPRPIVQREIAKYGSVYEEYCRVRPGITGLWQISGRNNTSYAERVAYDHYYINNWSVWMDLWILAKTVPVVISGYGAY